MRQALRQAVQDCAYFPIRPDSPSAQFSRAVDHHQFDLARLPFFFDHIQSKLGGIPAEKTPGAAVIHHRGFGKTPASRLMAPEIITLLLKEAGER